MLLIKTRVGPERGRRCAVAASRQIPQRYTGSSQIFEDAPNATCIGGAPEDLLCQSTCTQERPRIRVRILKHLGGSRVQRMLSRRQPPLGPKTNSTHTLGRNEGLDRADQGTEILRRPDFGAEQGDRSSQCHDVGAFKNDRRINMASLRCCVHDLERHLAHDDRGQVLPPSGAAVNETLHVALKEGRLRALVYIARCASRGEDVDDAAAVEARSHCGAGEHRHGGYVLSHEARIRP